LSGRGGGSDEHDQTKHGETSVDDFGFFGKSKLEGRKVPESILVALGHGFIVGVVRVDKERVTERERADGGSQRESEEVGVGDQNDGTLVADSVLSRDGGESTPLFQIEEHFGIRDETVSLAVCGGADEKPAEHGVAAIPLFGLHRRAPAPLGEGRELLLPVGDGIVVKLRVDLEGAHAGLLAGYILDRSKSRSRDEAQQKSKGSSEWRHGERYCSYTVSKQLRV
jgi:hypothetical protein